MNFNIADVLEFILGPFTTTDQILNKGFVDSLHNVQDTVIMYLLHPFETLVILWIIIQGMLIMRGDLDIRRGIISIMRLGIISGLVTVATFYNGHIGDFLTGGFNKGLLHWIDGIIIDGTRHESVSNIPRQLDTIMASAQLFITEVAVHALSGDDPSLNTLGPARNFLYIGLWGCFAIYEIACVFTRLLVAIGPLFLVGYLFDATRQISIRWATQILSYLLVLLMFGIIANYVIYTESAYLTGVFVALRVGDLITSGGESLGNNLENFTTPVKMYLLYEMDILIATGNALMLAVPTTIAAIVGGSFLPSSGGPAGLASAAGSGTPHGGGAGMSPALAQEATGARR